MAPRYRDQSTSNVVQIHWHHVSNDRRHRAASLAAMELRGSGSHVGTERRLWREADHTAIVRSRQTDRSDYLQSSFAARAKLVFDPPKGSLAERISQGLGWLTRGRQSDDRAERLLYNFTAIEALLSSDDKSAPVTQNIARNAATILTDDVAARANTAKDIRKLYDLRSSVVHAGSRPVAWTQANLAQNLAEELFWKVLPNADLSLKHADFIAQLSFASYGSPWPPRAPEAASKSEA